jgi:hypothetical protein
MYNIYLHNIKKITFIYSVIISPKPKIKKKKKKKKKKNVGTKKKNLKIYCFK